MPRTSRNTTVPLAHESMDLEGNLRAKPARFQKPASLWMTQKAARLPMA